MSAATSPQLNKPLPPLTSAYIPDAAGQPNNDHSFMVCEENPLLIPAAGQPQHGLILNAQPASHRLFPDSSAGMTLSQDASHNQKAASRDPSPESGKATLVDVRDRSTIVAPVKTATEVNDNDRIQMSRQLLKPGNRKTMRTHDTYRQIRESIAHQKDLAGPSLDQPNRFMYPEYSGSNSPEAMVYRSSEDEEQVTAPTSNNESLFSLGIGQPDFPLGNLTASKPSDRLWPNEPSVGVAVQTVPAEPVLSAGILGHQTPQSGTRYNTVATSTWMSQAKAVRCSGSSGAHAYRGDHEPNSCNSLSERPQEYERGTLQLSSDHCVNGHTGGYVDQFTLSRLDGSRTSHGANVDEKTVSPICGHVTQDFDRSSGDASVLRSATEAEKLLLNLELQSATSVDSVPNAHTTKSPQDEHYMASRPATPNSKRCLPIPSGPISQWSQSTDSEKHVRPPSSEGSHPLRPWASLGYSRRYAGFDSTPSRDQDSTISNVVGLNKASSAIPARSAAESFERERDSVTAARAPLPASGGPAQAQIYNSPVDIGRTPIKAYTNPISIAQDVCGRLEMSQTPSTEMLKPGAEILFKSGSKGRTMFSRLNGLFSSRRGNHTDVISSISAIDPRQTTRAVLLGSISHMHLQPPTAEVAVTSTEHMGTAKTSPTRPLTRAAAIPLSLNPPSACYNGMSNPNVVAIAETGVPSPSAGPIKHIVIDTAMTLRRTLLERVDEHEDPQRRHKLLELAEVLAAAIGRSRQAEMFCEAAEVAAREARHVLEKTMASVAAAEALAKRALATSARP